jgi:sigma-B regulation protein RsbU (phosphoserine phosphatase)
MTSRISLAAAPQRDLESLLEIRFAAQADRLKLVRGSVRAAARMCGFDDRSAQNIVLAVDEACQNVIVHAYKGRDDGEMVLTVFRLANGIVLRLRDFAPQIDPSRIKPRELDDIRPGHLGSHFMREIMDTVEFFSVPNGEGNLVEMLKYMDEER